LKLASSFGGDQGLEGLPDGRGALEPSGESNRPRRGGTLGGRIGLRLRFPADGEREALIPVFRADFFRLNN